MPGGMVTLVTQADKRCAVASGIQLLKEETDETVLMECHPAGNGISRDGNGTVRECGRKRRKNC